MLKQDKLVWPIFAESNFRSVIPQQNIIDSNRLKFNKTINNVYSFWSKSLDLITERIFLAKNFKSAFFDQ